MRILVTGAGGFIGSNLVPFLKEKGHYVRGVFTSLRKERAPLTDKADQLIYLDMRDIKAALFACQDIDYVIHLAADMGGVGYFHKENYRPFINNMTIDMNMLAAAHMAGVKRLFYASSACIYPVHLQMKEGNAPKLAEDMIYPANCDQNYGWQKLMMLRLCEEAPFETRVGILHTVFGPYQEIQGQRMKFPTAIATKTIAARKNGGDVEIWGNGRQIRSFLYIDDAMEKIYKVLTASAYGGPVNIASDKAFSVTEVANMCCDILGFEPKFTFTKDKPSGVLARNADNSKFEKLYGYENKISTYEGFKRLIAWIKEENKRK